MLGVLENVDIEAVSTTVSGHRVSLEERCGHLLAQKKGARLSKSTGFHQFSSVDKGICASDLAVHSAECLFDEVKATRDDIGAVIFVSQAPDYLCPATAFLIQKKLNLSKNIIAFDVNSSCAGFVYGIFIAGSLLTTMNKKILLCFGDVTSQKNIFYDDLTFAAILGDGGGAAIVSRCPGKKIWYSFDSYGEMSDAIIDLRGGARGYKITSPQGEVVNEKDNFCKMDGTKVMEFTLGEVPQNIEKLLLFAEINKDKLDLAFFHQANKLIVESLGNQLGIAMEKVPFYCQEIGNTDMASIPICMTEMERKGIYIPYANVLMSGFGAGLSVGSMILDLTDTYVMPTLEI